jgi:hypothetical protein
VIKPPAAESATGQSRRSGRSYRLIDVRFDPESDQDRAAPQYVAKGQLLTLLVVSF